MVVKDYDSANKMPVALKFPKSLIFDDDRAKAVEEFKHEAAIARMFSHKNVIQVLDSVYLDDVYLVFPLMQSSLQDEIMQKPFSTESCEDVIKSVLCGIGHIHEMSIVHGDIKPDNILINGEEVKIADFGLAVELPPGYVLMDAGGTVPYQAPEMWLKNGYNSKVDVWAVGCTMAEMKLRESFVVFEDKKVRRIDSILSLFTPDLASLNEATIKRFGSTEKQFLDLLQILLKYDSKERVSAPSALKHSFVAKA